MSFTITVPTHYGYVVLSTIFTTFLAPFYMGSVVITARKTYNVPLPNLYGTPGYHKEADAFNRVQRGHQNMLESLTSMTFFMLVGGLKHPIACSVFGVLYSVGCILYQVGYADTKLNVEVARYQKGGAIKYIGYFGALGSTFLLIGNMNQWW